VKKVLTTVDEVTPKWLTRVLSENGCLEHGEVISVQNILTKALPLSVVSRLGVTYSSDLTAPSKLFLKIANSSMSQANGKEVDFYQTVARKIISSALIRCYDAQYSDEFGRSHLLLEDLSETHVQPESPLPPTPLYRELAVESLAEFHASWWDHPQLGNNIGTLFSEQELSTFLSDVEKDVLRFVDFLGEQLSVDQRKIYDRLLASKEKIWGHLTDATRLTVTHGDAHWWNLLYPRDATKHRVCLFDWQLWHLDLGPRDLAFMIALGGYSERMSSMEPRLVRHYYDTLVAHGVRNYTWDDCWRDYRWSSLRNLNIPVILWSQGRDEKLWQSNLERALLAYDELRLFELLGE
jgi:hypothetical protein